MAHGCLGLGRRGGAHNTSLLVSKRRNTKHATHICRRRDEVRHATASTSVEEGGEGSTQQVAIIEVGWHCCRGAWPVSRVRGGGAGRREPHTWRPGATARVGSNRGGGPTLVESPCGGMGKG